MGRLTDKKFKNKPLHDLCGVNHDCTIDCEDCFVIKLYRKLAHYEDLEEQGRLIELPCAVDDMVYLIEEGCEDIYLPSTNYYYIEENPFDVWMLCGVGETVFLTKEEAEAKLAELKGE